MCFEPHEDSKKTNLKHILISPDFEVLAGVAGGKYSTKSKRAKRNIDINLLFILIFQGLLVRELKHV